MAGTRKDHDFDWVSARLDCCEAKEFERLRDLIEANCARRHEALADNCSTDIKFVPVKDGRELFMVELLPGPEAIKPLRSVRFELMDHRIRVSGTDIGAQCLTVTLNVQGECRFAINGEGEYLRWQVACRFLQRVLFDPRLTSP